MYVIKRWRSGEPPSFLNQAATFDPDNPLIFESKLAANRAVLVAKPYGSCGGYHVEVTALANIRQIA